jgi:hypothetical protein
MTAHTVQRPINHDLAIMERFIAHGIAADGRCRVQTCRQSWPCEMRNQDGQYINSHIFAIPSPHRPVEPVKVVFRRSPADKPAPFKRDYQSG